MAGGRGIGGWEGQWGMGGAVGDGRGSRDGRGSGGWVEWWEMGGAVEDGRGSGGLEGQ